MNTEQSISQMLYEDLGLLEDVILMLARYGEDIEKLLVKKLKLKSESDVASLHRALPGSLMMVMVLAKAIRDNEYLCETLANILERYDGEVVPEDLSSIVERLEEEPKPDESCPTEQ